MTESTSERRPFLSAPNPQRYFAAAAIDEARLRLVRAIARNEGPAIVVGGAGTGKSLLLAVLAEEFARRVAVVTLMGAQLCTRRALLQMILCELGLPYRGLDEGELRLAILQHLRGGDRAKPQAAANEGPRRLVLLVDEADTLPIRLLEELRVLTNVAVGGSPLVSLVLAGGPILEERFAEPQLDMFAQRIAARCYLAPLGREDTFQYVRSQTAAAGVAPERLFTADALAAIYAATGGVPRLVNQLGDQLWWMSEETGCAPLDGAMVQQAWSDLQQLPAPWNAHGAATTESAPAGDIVEFGDLDVAGAAVFETSPHDDLEDESPASIPIAAGRPSRAASRGDEFDVMFEAAEQLLSSFDQTVGLAKTGVEVADDETGPAGDPESPAAENPFDERFDEEEIVLDPYAAFESELLRTAPQVMNRLDRAFAGELHRCVLRAAVKPAALGLQSDLPDSTAIALPPKASPRFAEFEAEAASERVHYRELVMSLPTSRDGNRELLVIEDNDLPGAAVVPGKQFRRLFSRLETCGGRSLSG